MLVREWELLCHGWLACRLVQPLWKSVWRFLRHLQVEVSSDPAVSLWGVIIPPGSIQRYFHMCVYYCPSHNAERWTPSRCPSTKEQVKEIFLYSAVVKKNKIMKTWRKWVAGKHYNEQVIWIHKDKILRFLLYVDSRFQTMYYLQ